MNVLKTALQIRSEPYRASVAAMQALVDDLREKVAKICEGGGVTSRARHVSRGKLLPRDRVDMLLDPGTAFLEFSQLAAYGMYNDESPGAGMITGIGRVAGIE